MKNVIEENFNYTILGKNTTLDLNDFKTKLNNNVIVEGTSGCGKTRGFVIPNILNANSSYVVVDAKGIIYSSTKDYMRKKGYKIRVLNLRNLEQSDSFNPLEYVKSQKDVDRICKLLISFDSNDPFWSVRAREYLANAIEMMMIFTPKEKRTIPELCEQFYNLYCLCPSSKLRTKFRTTMNFLEQVRPKFFEEKNSSFMKINSIIDGNMSEKTFTSITEVAKGGLDTFYQPSMKKFFSSNDFNFKELGNEKTIYYVIVSDVDRSKDSISSLFFDTAFNELVNYADSCPNQRLKVPVRFIMDDFATNIDVSSNFPSLISSIRSRNISTVMIVQNIEQLVNKFGNNAETIISNNSTSIYMGSNSLNSMQRISQLADLSFEEVQTLPYDKEIIIINGKKPIIDDKYDLTQHPFYNEMKQDSYLDNIVNVDDRYCNDMEVLI